MEQEDEVTCLPAVPDYNEHVSPLPALLSERQVPLAPAKRTDLLFLGHALWVHSTL